MFITIICSIGLSACIPNDNPEYYSVSFIVDGTLYHSDTVKWKDSLTFPANPVKGGYDFDGWYEGENKITEIRQGYKEEITLTAKWNIINYTITYQLDGGTNSKIIRLHLPLKVKRYLFLSLQKSVTDFWVGIIMEVK